jgi:hypothetical protein
MEMSRTQNGKWFEIETSVVKIEKERLDASQIRKSLP